MSESVLFREPVEESILPMLLVAKGVRDAKRAYDEAAHPRGRRGRWVEKPDVVPPKHWPKVTRHGKVVPLARPPARKLGAASPGEVHVRHFEGEPLPRLRPGARKAEVLGSLRANGYMDLGHGVTIERRRFGTRVKGPQGTKSFMDSERAADHALEQWSNAHRQTEERSFGISTPRYRAAWSPGEPDPLSSSSRERALAQRESERGARVYPRIRPEDRRGKRISKAQALVDSGLADDLADARAQLADMGERGALSPGEPSARRRRNISKIEKMRGGSMRFGALTVRQDDNGYTVLSRGDEVASGLTAEQAAEQISQHFRAPEADRQALFRGAASPADPWSGHQARFQIEALNREHDFHREQARIERQHKRRPGSTNEKIAQQHEQRMREIENEVDMLNTQERARARSFERRAALAPPRMGHFGDRPGPTRAEQKAERRAEFVKRNRGAASPGEPRQAGRESRPGGILFRSGGGQIEGPFTYASGWQGYYDPKEGRYLGMDDVYMPRDFDPHTGVTYGPSIRRGG